MKPNRTRSVLFTIVMCLYIGTVAYLCFANFHKLPDVPKTLLGIPMDKIVHFCMFFPFPILAFLAYDKFTGTRKSVVIFALITFAVGCTVAAATEIGQALLTDYRSGDPTDFLADFLALLSSSLIATWLDIRKLSR